MNIIDELWYGNISPCERDFKRGSTYSELLGYIVRHKEDLLLPSEMDKLISFVQSIGLFTGSNTEFAERYCSFSGEQISAKALKQQMNKWRYALEEHGVYFLSHRSNGERILEVKFVPQFSDASAVSDAENGSDKSCDPCVPCVTDGSVIR